MVLDEVDESDSASKVTMSSSASLLLAALETTFEIFRGEFPETEAILSPVSLVPSLSDFSVSSSSVNDANEEIFKPSLLLDDA